MKIIALPEFVVVFTLCILKMFLFLLDFCKNKFIVHSYILWCCIIFIRGKKKHNPNAHNSNWKYSKSASCFYSANACDANLLWYCLFSDKLQQMRFCTTLFCVFCAIPHNFVAAKLAASVNITHYREVISKHCKVKVKLSP